MSSTRSPGRSAACKQVVEAVALDAGTRDRWSIARAATCRAPTGIPICAIPKATGTSSITAWSRSAGTAARSRCAMHNRKFTEAATLPQIPEWKEVDDAVAAGVDLLSGLRHRKRSAARLSGRRHPHAAAVQDHQHRPGAAARPRTCRRSPISTPTMGFDITEEVTWQGHRCVYLRCNTDHHCLSIYPDGAGGGARSCRSRRAASPSASSSTTISSCATP